MIVKGKYISLISFLLLAIAVTTSNTMGMPSNNVLNYIYNTTLSSSSTTHDTLNYFNQGDIYQALDKASVERKMLMVEFFAPWNYRSKWQNNVLNKSTNIVTFIQNNFIPYQLNTQTQIGAKFAKQYQVNDYPLILIFNHNGDVVNSINKTIDSDDLLIFLNKIVTKSNERASVKFYQLQNALNNSNLDQAKEIFNTIIDEPNANIFNKQYWDVFSNKNITTYNSKPFHFIIDNLNSFKSVIDSNTVNMFFETILDNYATELLINFNDKIILSHIDSLKHNVEQLSTVNPIMTILLEMLYSRVNNDINRYLLSYSNLQYLTINDSYFNIILTLEPLVRSGNKEQKRFALKIIKEQLKQSSNTAQVVLLHNIIKELQ